MFFSLQIKMTDKMRLPPTHSQPQSSTLTGTFPSTQSVAQAQTHQTTARPLLTSLLSDSCICFMHSLLWWTGRLVKRGMSALIYSLPGTDLRYLNPISVTTSHSCTLSVFPTITHCRWLWIHVSRAGKRLCLQLALVISVCRL